MKIGNIMYYVCDVLFDITKYKITKIYKNCEDFVSGQMIIDNKLYSEQTYNINSSFKNIEEAEVYLKIIVKNKIRQLNYEINEKKDKIIKLNEKLAGLK